MPPGLTLKNLTFTQREHLLISICYYVTWTKYQSGHIPGRVRILLVENIIQVILCEDCFVHMTMMDLWRNEWMNDDDDDDKWKLKCMAGKFEWYGLYSFGLRYCQGRDIVMQQIMVTKVSEILRTHSYLHTSTR